MVVIEAYHLNPPTPQQTERAIAAWKSGRLASTVKRGTRLWRTLRAPDATTAAAYSAVCYPSPTLCRFTPLMTGGAIVPIAYAATTRDISLWETILRDIAHRAVKQIPDSETVGRFTVRVETTRALKLIDLRRPKRFNLNVDAARAPDVSSAWEFYYPVTRQWAQLLHDVIPEANGIRYESHQRPGDCILVWGNFTGDPFRVTGAAIAVSESPVRRQLIKLADDVGVGIDFAEDVEPPE